MDGFHLDNTQLVELGLLSRKGAPASFDADGLYDVLQRVRRDQGPVYYPLFDRAADQSRAAAGVVTPQDRTILVEGNYLLLQEPPWSQLHDCFDLTVSLQVSEADLRTRLIARWREHGFGEAEAEARADSNDIPNGHCVLRQSAPANFVYAPDG